MARPKKDSSKQLSERVQERLDEMQMEFIKEASNVNEVQKMINVFGEMNRIAAKLDEA